MSTEEKKSWFSRLKDGLKKSSDKISEGLTNLLVRKKLDQETLDGLEELLISADLGPSMAAKICGQLAAKKFDQEVTEDEIKQALADEITSALSNRVSEYPWDSSHKPFVILVVGVNGSGKTTTLGKMAYHYKKEGHKVRLVAADTFRAAAVEQLAEWGARNNVPVDRAEEASDPASLAYQSLERAQNARDDLVLIDTAGRLHNKENLMAELSKIKRVLQKLDATAPHAALLVLDATIGQNAIPQVEAFHQIVGLTGLIVTKLDGTAKGGVVVALAEKFNIPLCAIGIGESIEDLKPFDAREFANSLVGLRMK